MQFGDLESYLETNSLEEEKLLDWFKQIVNGLRYLHSKDCHHRDIKSKLEFKIICYFF